MLVARSTPEGFKICEEPPPDESLAFSQPASKASKALVGRRIIRKWEGFGWVVGTIHKVNDDARRTIARDKVNFFVLYDGEEEDGPVPHVLESAEYNTTDDADYDSWLLLEAIEEIEEPIAMEEHVAAMEEE